MSRALITEGYLTDIADAIRAKNGSSDTYTPPQMAAAIAAIPTGGDVDVEALSVTANGTYTAPTGKAYSPVTVNVSGGGSQIETASIFRWIFQTYTTAWGVLKKLNGDVIGQNIDNAVNTATMDGQLMTVVFHGTSQSVEITAKASINLSVYQSGRTMGAITPTVYAMGNGGTQTLTSDNLYGGLYIEAANT